MPSSTLPGLPTALLAASNASTDLVYVALSPFGATDDRKQDRTNFFGEIPVPVGLGHPGTLQGSLLFYASTNANSISFRANTPAASLIYEWPNASPTVGQILSASAPAAGVVTLTWATVASTPGGSTTQLQYNNAGAFGGISGATTDGTNTTFGSTNLRATSPRITTGIQDVNGNELISFTATGSAVNELTLANATTGNPVTLTTTGGDTDISLTITPKGAGGLTVSSRILLANLAAAPSSVADRAIFYSKDVVAGSACGFVIGESGTIARLNDTIVYLTANASSTSSTVASTNLVLNVEAGLRYRFVASLHYNSQGVGGVRFALGGTATATSLVASYQIRNDGAAGTFIQQQTAALATQVALTGAGDLGYAEINFEIVVNAGGTLLVTFGQQVSNGTASLLLAGSSLQLTQS